MKGQSFFVNETYYAMDLFLYLRKIHFRLSPSISSNSALRCFPICIWISNILIYRSLRIYERISFSDLLPNTDSALLRKNLNTYAIEKQVYQMVYLIGECCLLLIHVCSKIKLPNSIKDNARIPKAIIICNAIKLRGTYPRPALMILCANFLLFHLHRPALFS